MIDQQDEAQLRGNILLEKFRNAGEDKEQLRAIALSMARDCIAVNHESLAPALVQAIKNTGLFDPPPTVENLDFDQHVIPALQNPKFWPEDLDGAAMNDTVGMSLLDGLKCLLDAERTVQFILGIKRAIETKQASGMPLKGIDAGTGPAALLAIVQAAYGVDKVFAIELNPDSLEAADKFINYYGFGDRIKLMHGDATKDDYYLALGKDADVFTMENYSGLLMDEKAREILNHLFPLCKEDVAIIPFAATLSFTVGTADTRVFETLGNGIAARLAGYEAKSSVTTFPETVFQEALSFQPDVIKRLSTKVRKGKLLLKEHVAGIIDDDGITLIRNEGIDSMEINTLTGYTSFRVNGQGQPVYLEPDSAEFLGKAYSFQLVDRNGDPAKIIVQPGQSIEVSLECFYNVGHQSTEIKAVVSGDANNPTITLTNGPLLPLRSLGIKQQGDENAYHEIPMEDALAYAHKWYTQIEDEDMHLLAKNIGEMWKHSQQAILNGEKSTINDGLIMESGSGTSLLGAIQAAAFCNEFVGLERSKACVDLANQWAAGQGPDFPGWEGWREIAGIMYAQAASGKDPLLWLEDLKKEQPDSYKMLCDWNKMEQEVGFISRARKDEFIERFASSAKAENPYFEAGSLSNLLSKKAKFVHADFLNHVEGNEALGLADIRPYVGKAKAIISRYVDESVTDNLVSVAHMMNNRALMLQPGGLMITNMMEGTLSYDGFGKCMNECYGTTRVFAALHEMFATPFSSEQGGIVAHDKNFRIVREGYSGVAALTGIRNENYFRTGKEALESLIEKVPEITCVRVGDRLGYCFVDEIPKVTGDMVRMYLTTEGAPNTFNISFATPGKEFAPYKDEFLSSAQKVLARRLGQLTKEEEAKEKASLHYERLPYHVRQEDQSQRGGKIWSELLDKERRNAGIRKVGG